MPDELFSEKEGSSNMININQRLKEDKAYSIRGARMGRPDWRGDPDRAYVFTLQRVNLEDYDYDQGGAYWGGGEPLWCAWANDEEDGEVRIFIRATNKKMAMMEVHEEYPNATFEKEV